MPSQTATATMGRGIQTLAFVTQTGFPNEVDNNMRRLVRSHAMKDYRQRSKKFKKGQNASRNDSKPQAGSPAQSHTSDAELDEKLERISKLNRNQCALGVLMPCGLRRDFNGIRFEHVYSPLDLQYDYNNSDPTKVLDLDLSRLQPFVNTLPPVSIFPTIPVIDSVPQHSIIKILNSIQWYFASHAIKSTAIQVPDVYDSWRAALSQSQSSTAEATFFGISLIPTVLINDLHPELSQDYLYLKGQTLQRIREGLRQPDTGFDENICSALLCLTWSEIALGSPTVETHFLGLAQIFGFQAGLLDIQSSSTLLASGNHPICDRFKNTPRASNLLRSLIVQDIMDAICSNRSPWTFDVPHPILRIHAACHNDEQFSRSSPLRMCGDFHLVHENNPMCNELLEVLWNTFSITEIRYLEADRLKHIDPWEQSRLPPLLATILAQKREPYIDPVEGSINMRISEAVRLAVIIHIRAVQGMMLHCHAKNSADMEYLVTLLRGLETIEWVRIPYVYLWVLMTCGAAAHNRSERVFIVGRISQFAFTFGLNWWDDFQQTVLNFLWFQKFLRNFNLSRVRESDFFPDKYHSDSEPNSAI